MQEIFQTSLSDGALRLLRNGERSSALRAWDTADLYLLREFEKQWRNKVLPVERCCVWLLNDNFGALTVSLQAWAIEHNLALDLICYSDSCLAKQAVCANLGRNNLSDLTSAIRYVDDIEALENCETPNIVIGRVPKAKAQLSYLACSLRESVEHNTLLMLAGMDKHLSKGQFEAISTYYGEASFLPAVQKARVWLAYCDHSLSAAFNPAVSYQISDVKTDDKLALVSLPNNFSYGKLDIGTRFLLENLAKAPVCEKVVDLACGNGVIGLVYARLNAPKHLIFSDESFQAIQAARKNAEQWENNGWLARGETSFQFSVDDALKEQGTHSVDFILCNPPFHQATSVGRRVAASMFREAHRCLSSSGVLWVVANRHLGYHQSIKAAFKNCEVVAGNNKFVILSAQKRCG